jgi:hypothetical protein
MNLDATKNFAKVTVSTGYGSGDTSIVLATGAGAKLPQPSTDGPFNLVWWDSITYGDPSDDPNVEIVRVTARTSDTLTVTRGQEGTSGTNKNTSAHTYLMILGLTAKMFADIQSALAGAGAISSVSNTDGTLTINPTTGAVVASLALGRANTWTGAQTFGDALLIATTPKITTGIKDANGNIIIGFTATGSAVNYLRVTNAAAANPAFVLLDPIGSDTNIGIKVTLKGTGAAFYIDGNNTAGNTLFVNGLIHTPIGFGIGFGDHYGGTVTAISGYWPWTSDATALFIGRVGLLAFDYSSANMTWIYRAGLGFSGSTLSVGNGKIPNSSDYISTQSPTPINGYITATAGSGSNIAGASLTFAGGRGTGSALGGSLIFMVAPHSTTNTTQNTLVNALEINEDQHLIHYGTTPTITAGGGTSPSVVGNDHMMLITIGTPCTDASITVTFNKPWTVNPPVCNAHSDTDIVAFKIATTLTTAVITASAALTAGSKLHVQCGGWLAP